MKVSCSNTSESLVLQKNDASVSESGLKLSYIKIFGTNIYVPIRTAKFTHKLVIRARIITSTECVSLLQEKEDKKKKELEDKERRKQEREIKEN